MDIWGKLLAPKEIVLLHFLGSGQSKKFLIFSYQSLYPALGSQLVLQEWGIKIWRKREVIMSGKIKEVIEINDNFVYQGEVVSVNSTGITPDKKWIIVLESTIDRGAKTFLIPLDKIKSGDVSPYSLQGKKVEIRVGVLFLNE